jgi:methionine-rich copper-binding protein CopC
MKRLLLAVFTASALSVAHAHTKLATTNPAADATVSAPKELVLEFGADVRLTAVTLTAASGTEVSLDALPTDVASKFSVAVRAPLAAGEYVVAWRAVGGDTHIVSGEFDFTVTTATAL